jgi:hypothetical protein
MFENHSELLSSYLIKYWLNRKSLIHNDILTVNIASIIGMQKLNTANESLGIEPPRTYRAMLPPHEVEYSQGSMRYDSTAEVLRLRSPKFDPGTIPFALLNAKRHQDFER